MVVGGALLAVVVCEVFAEAQVGAIGAAFKPSDGCKGGVRSCVVKVGVDALAVVMEVLDEWEGIGWGWLFDPVVVERALDDAAIGREKCVGWRCSVDGLWCEEKGW